LESGNQIVAQKCIELIKSLKDPTVLVDGIRSMDELRLFRKHWNFPIIAIICDEDVRHKRLSDRGRSDDSLNVNDIIERDRREVNFGLTEVIDQADYKVQNNSDIKYLKKSIRESIENILRE
jgi:dephospho-CoA kinase